MARLRDVPDRAKVSITTASNIINRSSGDARSGRPEDVPTRDARVTAFPTKYLQTQAAPKTTTRPTE